MTWNGDQVTKNQTNDFLHRTAHYMSVTPTWQHGFKGVGKSCFPIPGRRRLENADCRWGIRDRVGLHN